MNSPRLFRSAPPLVIAAACAALGLVACNKSAPDQPKGPVIGAAERAEATQIFAGRCTTCHGATGRGDGPASAGLTPRPRDFSDKSWQQSVTDEHIEKIIQLGGAAVGKNAAMPPNPDLTAKPAVIAALREHVRQLGR